MQTKLLKLTARKEGDNLITRIQVGINDKNIISVVSEGKPILDYIEAVKETIGLHVKHLIDKANNE